MRDRVERQRDEPPRPAPWQSLRSVLRMRGRTVGIRILVRRAFAAQPVLRLVARTDNLAPRLTRESDARRRREQPAWRIPGPCQLHFDGAIRAVRNSRRPGEPAHSCGTGFNYESHRGKPISERDRSLNRSSVNRKTDDEGV